MGFLKDLIGPMDPGGPAHGAQKEPMGPKRSPWGPKAAGSVSVSVCTLDVISHQSWIDIVHISDVSVIFIRALI